MVSAQQNQKLRSQLKVLQFDFDPDGTDPVDVSWQDMRDYGRLLVGFFRTVGTGNLDTFNIIANSQADGSGGDVVVKSHAVAAEPNAVGDYIFLECTAQELAALGTDLRYVSAQLEFATGTDEGVVTYIFGDPRWQRDGLTADVVA